MKKSFPDRFRSLPTDKKVVVVASVVAFISCFLPWYGINSRVINEWWNGFSSIGAVAGYIISVFSLLALALILGPLIDTRFDPGRKMPWRKDAVIFFLAAQSTFVALIFIPVYTQYSFMNASNSGTRFGLYLASISALVAAVSSWSSLKKGEGFSLRGADFVQVPRAHHSFAEPEEEGVEEEVEQEEMTIDEVEQETEPEWSPRAKADSHQPRSIRHGIVEDTSFQPQSETAIREDLFSELSQEDLAKVSKSDSDRNIV